MNSSSPVDPNVFDIHDGLSLLAAILILTIGLFGVVTNFSIIYIFYKESSERTGFNLICVFRAASNVLILSTTFLLVFFPKTVVGAAIYPPAVESSLIHFSLTLYLGNEYQIIVVASNRFCALFLPTYYWFFCGIAPTFAILVIIYSYRIYTVIVEQIPQLAKHCYTSYAPKYLSWIYDPNPDCEVVDNIVQVILYTFICMTCINVITFLKIITFYLSRNQTIDKETRRRIKRNIMLFFQTMLQDSLYLIDLTFTFQLSGLSSHRFWTFVSGTLVWECLHSIDGLIMIMFNERLSFLKKRFQPTPSITMYPTSRLNTITTSVATLPSIG